MLHVHSGSIIGLRVLQLPLEKLRKCRYKISIYKQTGQDFYLSMGGLPLPHVQAGGPCGRASGGRGRPGRRGGANEARRATAQQ